RSSHPTAVGVKIPLFEAHVSYQTIGAPRPIPCCAALPPPLSSSGTGGASSCPREHSPPSARRYPREPPEPTPTVIVPAPQAANLRRRHPRSEPAATTARPSAPLHYPSARSVPPAG